MADMKQLSAALTAKTAEIERAYAVAMGQAEIDDKIRQEVETLIEEFEDAELDGGPGSWEARDERIASTSIGRLLQELHEIQEQILDNLEDD